MATGIGIKAWGGRHFLVSGTGALRTIPGFQQMKAFHYLTPAWTCRPWVFSKLTQTASHSHEARWIAYRQQMLKHRSLEKQTWGFQQYRRQTSKRFSQLHLQKFKCAIRYWLHGLASGHKTRSFWIFLRFIHTSKNSRTFEKNWGFFPLEISNVQHFFHRLSLLTFMKISFFSYIFSLIHPSDFMSYLDRG